MALMFFSMIMKVGIVKKYKDIVFTPISKEVGDLMDPPVPSRVGNIVDWHKNANKYSDGSKNVSYTIQGNNLTVKSCMPMVDAFTSGYVHLTPFDIEIIRSENGINIKWPSSLIDIDPPIAIRPKEIENSNMPKIFGYDPLSFSWTTYWNAKTPPGYSCILTHPLNRPDLPFYSFSGVIDTDSWNLAGLHPFLLKEGWEGIIPAGTPMFQVIPFKRDNWESAKKDFDINDKKLNFKRSSVIANYYKHNLWSKKDYK